MILNFGAKTMFCCWVLETHSEVMDSSIYIIQAEYKSTQARRAFLRYVLHEVRVPLNSLSMGLQLLRSMDEDSGASDSKKEIEKQDTLIMMMESINFMSETINDVLCIQKIEDGKLELQYEDSVILKIISSVKHSLKV